MIHRINELKIDFEQREKFIDKYIGKMDGRSTSRIVNLILDLLSHKQLKN